MRTMPALGLLLLLGACGHEWQESTSSDGRYRVSFPGTPSKKVETVPTAIGTLTATFDAVELPTGAYAVCWCDYPEEVLDGVDPQAILDGARDGAAQRVRGKVVQDTAVQIGAVPGKEIRIETQAGVSLRVRLCLVENRLYQAIVTGPKPFEASADTQTFLDSFELLGVPAAPAK